MFFFFRINHDQEDIESNNLLVLILTTNSKWLIQDYLNAQANGMNIQNQIAHRLIYPNNANPHLQYPILNIQELKGLLRNLYQHHIHGNICQKSLLSNDEASP